MGNSCIQIIVPGKAEVDEVEKSDYVRFMVNPYWLDYPEVGTEHKLRHIGNVNRVIHECRFPVVVKTTGKRREAEKTLKELTFSNPMGTRYLLITDDSEYVAYFMKRFNAKKIDVSGSSLDLFGDGLGNVGGWANFLEECLYGTTVRIDPENSLKRYRP